ncbi:MAG: MgtC/SapB family protein [Oscillospiraceae bacterium]|nr:MgtC/SapB family protein [Oscillospiraceae bacterium]
MNGITDPIAGLLGQWSADLGLCSVVFRLLLSAILATVVGCERAAKRHSAGLRTFILITVSATGAMLLDLFLSRAAPSALHIIPAAVVVGTSTISVNSMLFSSKNKIKGLTTAAGLWTCGTIGLCVGAGFYTAAAACFLILLPSLALLTNFETYLKNRSNHFEVHLELTGSKYLQDFTTVIRQLGMKVDEIELNPAYHGSGLSVYSVSLSIHSNELRKYKTHGDIIAALQSLEYVAYIEEA